MDYQLRRLEKAAINDLAASWRFLQAAQRSGEKNSLRLALHIAGTNYLAGFLEQLNNSLAATEIPFNPLGMAAESDINSDYNPGYWWASLKERYSLSPEINMFGNPVCEPELRGTVPGFQQNYGLSIELHLHPEGNRTALVSDIFKGHKVSEWLGRGDPEEVYRLSQTHGYYGGDHPGSWVSQEKYENRCQLLRQRVIDAIYSVDPDLEARINTGQGFDRATIISPTNS